MAQSAAASSKQRNEIVQGFIDHSIFDEKGNLLTHQQQQQSVAASGASGAASGTELKPPGYIPMDASALTQQRSAGGGGATEYKTQSSSETRRLQEEKAMQIAKSPGQSLFMLMFMAFITGSSLSIYTIFMLSPIIFTPINNFINFRTAFQPVEHSGIDLTKHKAIYLLLSCVSALVPIYKIHIYGLFPATSADWISMIPTKRQLEATAQAVGLV
eukprot:gb/GECG01016736.1/.p1 GENE.gb/GECG01016736.1/~~gb/GECG01016736.1/.p1  ORF type:complete len:215 (+),score=23.56 gb/GECG01016736.1/:1-645(+)